jgi:hypothetical protein
VCGTRTTAAQTRVRCLTAGAIGRGQMIGEPELSPLLA